MSANMIDLLLKSLGETCYMVLIAIVPTLITGRFRRAQGAVIMAVYAVYVGLLCSGIAA